MQRPRLLDLFCCAGGASMGYHQAGFEVVGVDKDPQPHYPFEFHRDDAVEFVKEYGHEFDAIAGSPPCQLYANVTKWKGTADNHPDLIGPTRDALIASGKPWVIENVPEAARDGKLRADVVLCGSQFGLRVKRHRAFEVGGFEARAPDAPCRHVDLLPFMHKGERAYADAMGCTWMSAKRARQAIPPAYTEYLGRQLLEVL